MLRRALATLACGLALVASTMAAKVYPRYPIGQMMTDPTLYYQYQLLLLGMHEMTTTPDITNIWSHYQLGGIHGLPFVTYNDAETGVEWMSMNGTWWGGHCWHFTNPFLHWHRYYIIYYEEGMRRGAAKALKAILRNGRGMSAAEKRQWRQAYKALRLPRWDWMDPRIAQDGLPSILLNETMDVVNPARPMGPKITLHNPFHSYQLQASPYLSMPRDNTVYSEKIYNEQPFNISRGEYTYRYPRRNAQGELTSDSALFNAVFETFSPALDIEVRLALQPNTWDCWLLGPANRNPNVVCDNWIPAANDIHSNIHVLTGGVGPTTGVTGVMLQAETTGLDTIFFLHHSHVDWIFALYQAFKPQVPLTPGNNEDGAFLVRPAMEDYNAVGSWSEMPPFTPNARPNSKFYLAKQANNYFKYDYTYSEIAEAARAVGLSTQKLPTDYSATKVAAFQQKLDEILFAKYSLKHIYAGYWQAVAFVIDVTMLPEPVDQFNIEVYYVGGSNNIKCGSWGSFADQGMLGNNAMGSGFVERYPSIQLTQCLLDAGVVSNTNPLPANAANPGAGPQCRPVPEQLDPLDTSLFEIKMTTSYSGSTPAPLTQAQVAAAIKAAPTYWAFEETFIKLPNGLNQGLNPC